MRMRRGWGPPARGTARFPRPRLFSLESSRVIKQRKWILDDPRIVRLCVYVRVSLKMRLRCLVRIATNLSESFFSFFNKSMTGADRPISLAPSACSKINLCHQRFHAAARSIIALQAQMSFLIKVRSEVKMDRYREQHFPVFLGRMHP